MSEKETYDVSVECKVCNCKPADYIAVPKGTVWWEYLKGFECSNCGCKDMGNGTIPATVFAIC